MTRRDHGKPRNQGQRETDDGRRGELGPFLVYLSGSNPNRKCKTGHADNWQGYCTNCGAIVNWNSWYNYMGGCT